MEHLNNIKAVRDLLVQRRRAAVTQIMGVMDHEPEQIHGCLAKMANDQAVIDVIDRIIVDEERLTKKA